MVIGKIPVEYAMIRGRAEQRLSRVRGDGRCEATVSDSGRGHAMYEINPGLTGFSCLRTGENLGVADYFEGSPKSASEGYPASLRATYDEEGAWPVTSRDKGMARYRRFLPYLTFPSLGEGGTPLLVLTSHGFKTTPEPRPSA